jgi:xanthine/uracil permease
MIFTGLLLFILGITGLVNRLLFLFTPLVMGSFLLILALQLSGTFLEGMLGVQVQSGVDYGITAISFAVFVLVILLSNKGKGWMKSYSLLLGILFGWLLYVLSGKTSNTNSTPSSFIKLPDIFAWGAPHLNSGMIVTSIVFTFILISNTVAAITAVKQVVPETGIDEKQTINRGSWAGGISHVLSAVFSTIGIVPLPVSAGFIRLTGQKQIIPFLLASLALAGIAFVPAIVDFLAMLPGPIACAASLASFVQMIGISFQSLLKDSLDERRLTILGITLLIGMGLMFLPKELFKGMPTILQYIFSNGLIVGTIIVIVLEQLWKPKNISKGVTLNES